MLKTLARSLTNDLYNHLDCSLNYLTIMSRLIIQYQGQAIGMLQAGRSRTFQS